MDLSSKFLFRLKSLFIFKGQKFALLEEKAVLASFIRAYKWTAVEDEADIVPLAELIQRPKNGIQIKISKRIC